MMARTTDTITEEVIQKNKAWYMHKISRVAVPVLLALTTQAKAAEWDINPRISSSYTYYDVDSDGFSERSSSVWNIQPGLVGTLEGARANGVFGIDYKRFERDFNGLDNVDVEESTSESFTEYFFDAELDAVTNVLTLGISGNQQYINLLDTDLLVTDFILGSDQLVKSRQGAANFSLNATRIGPVGLIANGQIARFESDQQFDLRGELREIRDTNKFVNTTLFQGTGNDAISWQVTSVYNDNDGSIQSDLRSRTLEGNFYARIYKGLRLSVVGRTEDNELSNDNEASEDDLDFDSYGIGLSWFSSENRFIDLTFNESSRSNEDGEKEQFLGLNMRWQFSTRTQMDASYSRRFFGETGQFSLSHNTRNLRTQIQYTEDLTTFSQLLLQEQTLGTLVCPAGGQSIADCFQPSSLEYELQPGESFQTLSALIPQLTDEVIVNKILGFTSTYQKSRLATTLSIQRADVDFLGTNRSQRSHLIFLNNTLQAGVRTRFLFNVGYNRTFSEADLINDLTWSGDASAEYAISRDLDLSLTLRYVNRKSNDALRDLLDRRVTLALSYRY